MHDRRRGVLKRALRPRPPARQPPRRPLPSQLPLRDRERQGDVAGVVDPTRANQPGRGRLGCNSGAARGRNLLGELEELRVRKAGQTLCEAGGGGDVGAVRSRRQRFVDCTPPLRSLSSSEELQQRTHPCRERIRRQAPVPAVRHYRLPRISPPPLAHRLDPRVRRPLRHRVVERGEHRPARLRRYGVARGAARIAVRELCPGWAELHTRVGGVGACAQ